MREPEAVFWGFVFPVIMVIALGLLFSKKSNGTETISIAINQEFVSSDQYKSIQKDIEAFTKIKLIPVDINTIAKEFKEEKFIYALNIQKNNENIFQVKVLYASIAEKQFEKESGIFDQFVNQLNKSFIEKNTIALPFQIKTEKVIVKSDKGGDVSYVDWLLPGVIGLNLFISCAFGMGITVVENKKNGKYKKIATTPLPHWKFMLTMSFQRMVILYLQAITILIAGYLIFSIKPIGSLIEYLLVLSLSIFTFMIFGFAIASICKTIEKAMAIANVLFVASMLLSGAYFSNEGLPYYLKFFADITPVTLCVDATRGIYTYGKPLSDFWLQCLGLSVWSIAGILFNIKFFKWTNE